MIRLCSVDGCARPLRARGYCSTHWTRWRKWGDPTIARNPEAPTFEERFWLRVYKTDTCWLWTGARHGGLEAAPSGIVYGEVWRGGRPRYAHRVSYEMAYGPLAPGQVVCHHCDTPLCVRPDHLFVGTQADNVRDMWAKGRGVNPPLRRRRVA